MAVARDQRQAAALAEQIVKDFLDLRYDEVPRPQRYDRLLLTAHLRVGS